jgi:hypothetical protein
VRAFPAGGPSQTAILAAVARAMHAEGPPPRVLEDGLASGLAGPEGDVLRDHYLPQARFGSRPERGKWKTWLPRRYRTASVST